MKYEIQMMVRNQSTDMVWAFDVVDATEDEVWEVMDKALVDLKAEFANPESKLTRQEAS